MSTVVIDRGTCRRCKACVSICPTSSLILGSQGLFFNSSSCGACGQCIARCPQGALSWDGSPPRLVDREAFPRPERLEELIAGRLPRRRFCEEEIDPAVLKRIATAAHRVPADAAGLEIVVVTDLETRRSLEILSLDRLEKIYLRRYARPWIFGLLKKFRPAVNDLDRIRTRLALKKGSVFNGAPALILVLGDSRRPQAAANAPYALADMILLAETIGLGACPSETARTVLDGNPRARRILSLPRTKGILGVLLVGRPEVRFPRAGGRPLPVRWLGEPPESIIKKGD